MPPLPLFMLSSQPLDWCGTRQHRPRLPPPPPGHSSEGRRAGWPVPWALVCCRALMHPAYLSGWEPSLRGHGREKPGVEWGPWRREGAASEHGMGMWGEHETPGRQSQEAQGLEALARCGAGRGRAVRGSCCDSEKRRAVSSPGVRFRSQLGASEVACKELRLVGGGWGDGPTGS